VCSATGGSLEPFPTVSVLLSKYATENVIYMKINYVNPDYVHVLLDLPTHLCIEEAMHLFIRGLRLTG
jgi:hypothetical protein